LLRSARQIRALALGQGYDAVQPAHTVTRSAPFFKVSLLASLIMTTLIVSACSRSSPRNVPRPRTPTHTASLTLADNHKLVDVLSPANITVSLPYTKASGDVWQLASGGAGFSQIGTSTFETFPSSTATELQVFRFHIASNSVLPIVLDYGPPGPLPNSPTRRFQVTIRPTAP
jgi:hypothetical protein